MAKYDIDKIGKVHNNIIVDVIGGLMAGYAAFVLFLFSKIPASVDFIRCDEFLRGASRPVGSQARRSRRQIVGV